MYRIYCDGECIFDVQAPSAYLHLEEVVLTLEENTSGSLEFKIPGDVEFPASKFVCMKSKIVVTKNDVEIWWGRPVSYKEDFFRRKTVYCEGALAYLNDTFQWQQEFGEEVTWYTFTKTVLERHNKRVGMDPTKMFYLKEEDFGFSDEDLEEDPLEPGEGLSGYALTEDTEETEGTGRKKYTAFEKTFKTIMDMVSDFKGRVELYKENDKFYLRFKTNKDSQGRVNRDICPQIIEFGKNLMDFTRDFDYSELCTAILPIGATLQKETSNLGPEVKDIRFSDGARIYSKDEKLTITQNDDDGHALASRYKCSNRIAVKSGEKYYYSGRQNRGYVMYAIGGSDGTTYSIHRANDSEDGFTDDKETLIEIPAGATELFIAGVDVNNYPIKLYRYVENVSTLDDYVTIGEVNKRTDIPAPPADPEEDNPYKNENMFLLADAQVIAKYGRIERQVTWPKIDDPKTLLKAAKKYLKEGQFEKMTIDVTALDLQLLGISEPIQLSQSVHCYSKYHGMDTMFPVTKITIPMCKLEDQKFSLNYTNDSNKSLSSITTTSKTEINNKIANTPNATSVLRQAHLAASKLLNQKTNGYAVYTENETVWMNHPDKEEATAVWRFNVNGLGYAEGAKAYYMPSDGLKIALTRDGKISADRILTGYMLADRIRGGTLYVGGGETGKDGVINVYNANNVIYGRWNKNGLILGRISKSEITLSDASIENQKVFTDPDVFGLRMNSGITTQYFNGVWQFWTGSNCLSMTNGKYSVNNAQTNMIARNDLLLGARNIYIAKFTNGAFTTSDERLANHKDSWLAFDGSVTIGEYRLRFVNGFCTYAGLADLE